MHWYALLRCVRVGVALLQGIFIWPVGMTEWHRNAGKPGREPEGL